MCSNIKLLYVYTFFTSMIIHPVVSLSDTDSNYYFNFAFSSLFSNIVIKK